MVAEARHICCYFGFKLLYFVFKKIKHSVLHYFLWIRAAVFFVQRHRPNILHYYESRPCCRRESGAINIPRSVPVIIKLYL